MYLSRELTDSSLPKIGKEFGGRDHTTVIHATSKIARLIREDRSVYNLVQELTARIKQVTVNLWVHAPAASEPVENGRLSPVGRPQREPPEPGAAARRLPRRPHSLLLRRRFFK